jgi:hypothetical protein
VAPVPVDVKPPGVDVIVQVPLEGRPLKSTDPVAVVQVGCVTAPITGVLGVTGLAFKIAEVEEPEVQPRSFVTVKV